MLNEKCKGLLFMAMVAVALMLSATSVGAACTAEELASATCFTGGGFEVRTVAPFPIQNSDGTTAYNYSILPLPGTTKNVSTVDILVPLCNSDFNLDGIIDNLIKISTGDPNGWRSYPPGQGSSNTNYGLGATQYSVFEQNFSTPPNGSFYLHTTKGVSGNTSMALKIGSQLAYGTILGPACYEGKTAATTGEVIQLDPLNPALFITVFRGADGGVEEVLDAFGNIATGSRLSDSQIWVCNNPILNSDGSYNGCNDPLSQLTFVPDGAALRFGKHTLTKKFISSGGVTYTYCFCGAKAVSCTSYCP